jgi:protein-disulfide isomerase
MSQARNKIYVLTAVLGIGSLWICPVGSAQQKNSPDDVAKQLSTLKNDVDAIKKQQQQILDKLNELERLFQGSSGSAPPLPARLNIQGETIRGRATARVIMVAYADFECPFCEKYMTDVFPKILTGYINPGRIKYVFRDFPLSIHPHAMTAARGAHCAADQGRFWEMHDKLFANQTSLGESDIEHYAQDLGLDTSAFDRCLASDKYTDAIRKSLTDAERMGVDGTPTFFLGIAGPNGEIAVKTSIVGEYPYETFKTDIDELLDLKK